MKRKQLFISSVQSEFAKERKALCDYIQGDPLFGKFFEPFIFENLPAQDQKADKAYLKEVEKSDIYIGIFGKEYGSQDKNGLSPTLKEYEHAGKYNKTRLIFVSRHKVKQRHIKQADFIKEIETQVIRKSFQDINELKTSVYASLVHYLEEKEIIRFSPFDASVEQEASLNDLDRNKINDFIRVARSERGFPLTERAKTEDILTHLDLLKNDRPKNSALLLFAKQPQSFFTTSMIKCASFPGVIVEKPILSMKVFKGDVFKLADQAVEFVLSKLDYTVGTRQDELSVPGKYEISKKIISEAVINAVVHRDYTSNASVQVMVFKDRVEILNPGTLPMGWTTAMLKRTHTSVPANPLLAHAMYLKNYIEHIGTGTLDIYRLAKEEKLPEPKFIQENVFRTIIFRKIDQVIDQVSDQVSDQVMRLLKIMLPGENKRNDLMDKLGLTHRATFRNNYINRAIKCKLIEMTQPESPKSPTQAYKITKKGKRIIKQQ